MAHPLIGILIFILSLIIAWVIASVPVWLSAKLFSSKASLGKAMVATFVGILAFLILDRLISPFSHLIALIVGFIAVLWVFKTIFDVGWLSSLGIAIVAFVITMIILVILAAIGLGLSLL
ncbi:MULTISPECIES: hypothetical protein [Metallosphaera]|uniref:Phage holin family protein n=2 Tax=Metallosphaera sedula TaxID=43687 RepID=A4YEA0_METS5|nr:hypothetical protein [Metallosphaera sedula]ABP94752.1 hypothetical protein Msed_0577 [Metallosphaera sedula DSM 5348]AIM26739.1 hypothetical protein HA72_0577 [Metallosphaera sedula]AKV73695.1 hypothetical protein MsedA_0589 [Metallosphaera sedula]AKV75935.1 hypothetical protein MsedB_0589 [Metallosphaera sedula]AKV78186.1 hypothetical protein MsedC_0588 [Metallosphaera sedula]